MTTLKVLAILFDTMIGGGVGFGYLKVVKVNSFKHYGESAQFLVKPVPFPILQVRSLGIPKSLPHLIGGRSIGQTELKIYQPRFL